MGFFEQPLYLEFEAEIRGAKAANSNTLVLSLPGMGADYLAKRAVERLGEGFGFIEQKGVALTDFSIVNFDMPYGPEWVEMVDSLVKTARVDQKVAVIVKDPSFLKSDIYKLSYTARHTYRQFVVRAWSPEETAEFCRVINPELTVEQTQRIYELSGGVAKVAKILAANVSLLSKPENGISEFEAIRAAVIRFEDKAQLCDGVLLEKMGLVREGKMSGKLLTGFKGGRVQVEVARDLGLIEKGITTGQRLTKVEAAVVRAALADGEHLVTKEKLAECKWGAGSYDKYSDQAISKTMQRLNAKLKAHTFEVITGVGYKLVVV